MGIASNILAGEWISNRLPSFSLGEINVDFFLKCYGVAASDEFTDANKSKVYSAYVDCIKKLFVSFGKVSEEGASVSIDVKYYEQEIETFKKFLPEEFQAGDDIINAGNW